MQSLFFVAVCTPRNHGKNVLKWYLHITMEIIYANFYETVGLVRHANILVITVCGC